METYEFIGGLEMHVQLNTVSKAFCSDSNTFGNTPNTKVSAISLAHPGTLPVANLHQLKAAIKLGLALSCDISNQVLFDRKNYTYPDLPKGYQLTQDTMPICIGGQIYLPESNRLIRLHHIHMEEDAGKSIHDMDPDYSLIDLNRAGVPLLEIVTEPDFRSPDEIAEFIEIMQKLVIYLNISDGQMEEGSIRCDCNVSIRVKGSEILNDRCEIKNINSKRFAKIATEYEFNRQKALVQSGEKVQQQTLHFDKQQKITYPLRTKEDAHDYRYFPDPDLPPYQVTQKMIDEIQESIGILPWALEKQLMEQYPLSASDARTIAYDHGQFDYVHNICSQIKTDYLKTFFDIYFQKLVKLGSIEKFPSDARIIEFIELLKTNKVNKLHGYEILFDELIAHPEQSPSQLAERLDILQSQDEDFIKGVVTEVLDQHPQEVLRFKNGEKKLMGFLIGQVMKVSKGKAPAQEVSKIINELAS